LRRTLTLRELSDITATLPYIPGSAVARAIDPEGWQWGQAEELLATVVDSLAWLMWQNASTPDKPAPNPDLYPRPWPTVTDDDNDDWVPTETFDTPTDYEAWRATQYG